MGLGRRDSWGYFVICYIREVRIDLENIRLCNYKFLLSRLYGFLDLGFVGVG